MHNPSMGGAYIFLGGGSIILCINVAIYQSELAHVSNTQQQELIRTASVTSKDLSIFPVILLNHKKTLYKLSSAFSLSLHFFFFLFFSSQSIMHFYNTTTSADVHNGISTTPNEDELDERWDGNLNYHHLPDLYEQPKNVLLLQQHPNLTQALKEVLHTQKKTVKARRFLMSTLL